MSKLLVSIILGVSSIFLLSGCSTKYQSSGFTGGYQESQLAPNIFSVSFKGNGYTSKEKVADFAMLRSAELTIQNGFKYFSIISEDSDISTIEIAPSYETTGTVNSFGAVNLRTKEVGGMKFRKASNTNRIICYKEKPVNQLSYEAEFIINSLKKKYEIE